MPQTAPTKKKPDFDPRKFLATIGDGRKVVGFPRKQTIFGQGDVADAVFYIQKGKVRLSVVSKTGKEATLGILTEGQFFGEGSLAGQSLRMGSATAMTDCAARDVTVMRSSSSKWSPKRINEPKLTRPADSGTSMRSSPLSG